MDDIFGRAKLRFVVPVVIVGNVLPYLLAEPSEDDIDSYLRASMESVVLGTASYLMVFMLLWIGWCSRAGLGDVLGPSPRREDARRLVALGVPSVGIAFVSYYLVFYPLSFLVPDFVLWWAVALPELLVPPSRDDALAINVGMILLVVLVAPLVEELTFRGFLFGRLMAKFDVIVAAGISSMLFALLHPDLLGAFVFGCIACLVRVRFGSLIAPILLHASHNGIVMLLLGFEVLVLGTQFEYTLEEFRSYWWCAPIGAVIGLPWMYRYCRAELLPVRASRGHARA